MPAASRGRRIQTWVDGDVDAGGTTRRSKGGGKEPEGEGKAAWRRRWVPTPQGTHPPLGSSSACPLPVLSVLGAKGTGFPNGAGGPARPPTPGSRSPPAGHTPSPLFGKKKQPFPSHKRRIAKNLEPLPLPAAAAGDLQTNPCLTERTDGGEEGVPWVLAILHAHSRRTSLRKQNAQSHGLKGPSAWLRPGAADCSCKRRQVRAGS